MKSATERRGGWERTAAIALPPLVAALLALPSGELSTRRGLFIGVMALWTLWTVRQTRTGGPHLCAWWTLLVAAVVFDAVALGQMSGWQFTAADRSSLANWYGSSQPVPWWVAAYLMIHQPSRLVVHEWEIGRNLALWWTGIGLCSLLMKALGIRQSRPFANPRIEQSPDINGA